MDTKSKKLQEIQQETFTTFFSFLLCLYSQTFCLNSIGETSSPGAPINDTSRAQPAVSFHRHAIALQQGPLPHFRPSHSVAFHSVHLDCQHSSQCHPAPPFSPDYLPPLYLFDQFLSIFLSFSPTLFLQFEGWLTAVSFHIIASQFPTLTLLTAEPVINSVDIHSISLFILTSNSKLTICDSVNATSQCKTGFKDQTLLTWPFCWRTSRYFLLWTVKKFSSFAQCYLEQLVASELNLASKEG